MIWIWLAPCIVLSVIVVYLLLVFLMIVLGLNRRNDYNPYLVYYTNKDYPTLEKEEYSFTSCTNTLKAFVYYYPREQYKAVITFIHGIGAGHEAYTSVIERLCSYGYIVFAYDQTGCGESEGKGRLSAKQGLYDLIEANRFLASLDKYSKYPFYIMGHSWGGFLAATSSLLPLDRPYEKIVSASPINKGLYDVKIFNGPLLIFKPGFILFDTVLFPIFSKVSTKSALKQTKQPTLVIYGENDNLIPLKVFRKYDEVAKENDIVSIVSLPNRRHQPLLSKAAEDIINDEIPKITKYTMFKVKEKNIDTLLKLKSEIDFETAIKLDETVFAKIKEFFDEDSSDS